MLYLAATPIGNLGDITFRTVETLKTCDEVWCEDTRRTGQLLQYLGLKKPLISCHEHTEKSRCPLLIEKLRSGMNIVYVSDAGMPGISDPGALLLSACQKENLPVTVLPGASAVLTAAVLSGLPIQPFTFFGFLPRDSKPRKQMLAQIARCGHVAILYESPHRVQNTLQELLALLGDCPAALCRELTKLHEEIRRGTLTSLLAEMEEEPRGECVLCVLVPEALSRPKAPDPKVLLKQLLETMSIKDAAAEAAHQTGFSKKEMYRMALALQEANDT